MTRMKESGIDWIGQIPEEWEVDFVNHIFEEHKQKNKGNKEKNLLSLSYGRIIRKSIDTSFGLLPESFDTYNIIQRGDIVLRLTDLQNDKKSLRVGLARENGIITSAYLTLRLKNLESNASYMYYLLHTYDICKVFYNFGGGVRQGGTWSDIYKMELLIPPCNEQQKIADFLDKKTAQLDKVKALLEEQIQKLKDYRASLIYETVTKGLDKTVPMKDSGINWIGQVPHGWGVSKFKYLLKIKDGTHDTPQYVDEGIPLITTKNIDCIANNIDFSDAKNITYHDYLLINKRSDVSYEDILMPMIGTVGGAVQVTTKKPFSIKNVALFKVGFDSLMSRYLYYLLNSNIVKNQLEYLMSGGVQSFVSITMLEQLQIIVQPEIDKKNIVSFLDKKTAQIDKLIQIKNQQIDNINKQRQTLIYDYVTGKRRV